MYSSTSFFFPPSRFILNKDKRNSKLKPVHGEIPAKPDVKQQWQVDWPQCWMLVHYVVLDIKISKDDNSWVRGQEDSDVPHTMQVGEPYTRPVGAEQSEHLNLKEQFFSSHKTLDGKPFSSFPLFLHYFVPVIDPSNDSQPPEPHTPPGQIINPGALLMLEHQDH